jgi:DNA-binding response OmpR family regulator
VHARSTSDALRLLRRGDPIDLVVLDLPLLDEDAAGLGLEMRADDSLSGVPLLVLRGSSLASEQQFVELAVRTDGVLSKPFDDAELLTNVRELVGARV